MSAIDLSQLPAPQVLEDLDYEALYQADVVETINRHCNEILKMPDVAERMTTLSMQPKGGAPAQMRELAQGDYDKYARLTREFNIRAD